jgi:hypothetical protein
MKPTPSALKIIDFALTNLEYSLVPPTRAEDINASKFFERYDLDIDFGMNKEDHYIKVFIKAEVNRAEKKLPGYSFTAEAVCFFNFNSEIKLDEEVKQNMEGFSTIYIALNSLRGLISNFTSNAPFGRYILPSIDLNDLIEKKKQALLKNKPARKSSSVKSSSKKLKSANK